ncbi:hypothetical protein MKX08_000184 [Trichoderma sp. CBMAI-0020]|nr:hypothetical protein MKX08_000184 [Trichoderma sp. CBMAI-0020]
MDHSDEKKERQEPSTNPSNPVNRLIILERLVQGMFNGDTAKLRKFQYDLRTYFKYYYLRTFSADKFEARIRFAGT